jgi:hypothetical protein
MRVYNFKKAKEVIKKYKDMDLKSASLGMKEDWHWTAETVWANGKFTKKLNEKTEIGGITKSYWATPVLELDFEDHLLTIDCYTNE